MSDPINEANLDIKTGLVVYKGITYTLEEFLDEWEDEDNYKQDAAAELRDVKSDTQNLWGNKPYFKDTWKKRIKPFKRRKGYPRDL